MGQEKRKNAPKFDGKEINLLLDTVCQFLGIVEDKRADADMWKIKQETWKRIAAIFNANNASKGVHRNVANLHSKYVTFKKMVRKKLGQMRRDRMRLGTSDIRLNALEERIACMLDPATNGVKTEFDIDSMPATPQLGEARMANNLQTFDDTSLSENMEDNLAFTWGQFSSGLLPTEEAASESESNESHLTTTPTFHGVLPPEASAHKTPYSVLPPEASAHKTPYSVLPTEPSAHKTPYSVLPTEPSAHKTPHSVLPTEPSAHKTPQPSGSGRKRKHAAPDACSPVPDQHESTHWHSQFLQDEHQRKIQNLDLQNAILQLELSSKKCLEEEHSRRMKSLDLQNEILEAELQAKRRCLHLQNELLEVELLLKKKQLATTVVCGSHQLDDEKVKDEKVDDERIGDKSCVSS